MAERVRVIGVPMDLGADRRGVDMGPSAIRYGGLAEEFAEMGLPCVDGGDLSVPRPEERDPDAGEPETGRAKFLRETREVCADVRSTVEATLADGEFPLVLGGDHSIAIGTVAGAASDGDGDDEGESGGVDGDGTDIGVVWFDAHADFNTPATSPSGNVHGMSLAAILGVGEFADSGWAHVPAVPEENVALVGLRDLDQGEKRLLGDSDVTAYTMTDLDDRGVPEVVEEALSVASEGVSGLHVSLDMDWLDPTEAPGVGTAVRGGVSYREAHVAMELVHRHADDLRSMEVVEVNPILDRRNRTAELAVELAASALGKRIL